MGTKDFRDAFWLDPECDACGSCQSLRFKELPPPLTDEQVAKALYRVQIQFASDVPTVSFAMLFARAIERAHGIGT